MSNDQTNPYAPTVSPTVVDASGVDPVLLTKVNAIIKDAGQFWIAMVLCLLCSAIGSLLIGLWYAARLMQWNAIAKSQPLLLDPNAAPGSVAAKFQGAKIKLIIGMVFGIVILFAFLAYFGFLGLGTARMVPR